MLTQRIKITALVFLFVGFVVTARLFYWQIISGSSLAELAESQHSSILEIPAARGHVLTSDNFALVSNQPAFLAYAYLPYLKIEPEKAANLIAPIIRPDPDDPSASAQLIKTLTKVTQASLAARLQNPNTSWVSLARKLPGSKKEQLEKLALEGIGFELEQTRFYPEASMSSQLLGFVGSNSSGNPQGYFGLEGFYDLELKGRPGIIRQEKDATGKPILVGDYGGFDQKNGRALKLHLDRSVQRIVETELEKGLDRYGAVSGEVIILDPKTGGILASAALPQYNPQKFEKFDSNLFKNPVIADSYEPGSTFKVLVMASAIDAEAVKPDTKCDICEGPLKIGKYTIRTWNEQYQPNINMTEVLEKSDNIGMVFVGQQLGKENLFNYLKKFGIGDPTGIDLQEESVPEIRPLKNWGDVDLATASFGQGIAITALQMVRAVAAIANDGILLEPHVVKEIVGDTIVTINPKPVRRVISEDTAQVITDMMVQAVYQGEAQWTNLKGYQIAGKTGTAQIAVQGHYDQEKTIASFVGFAPANDPKFVMLVKLREPTSSPWAAETAAAWLRREESAGPRRI